MRKRYLYLPLTIIISYFLSISISSCEKASIVIGTDFIANTPTNIAYVDTLTTQISTVYVDSFITSAPAALLIGDYTDAYFGVVSSRSFMQFGLPASSTIIPSGSIYDSTEIILRFNNKYYYGDTSKPFTINVNQLADPITLQPNQPVFYNIDSFSYNPATIVLGSTQLPNIRPAVIDTLSITLNGDSTGKDLFNKFVTGAPEIQNNPAFLNYFKGLAISGSGSNSMVGAFKDSIEMRLHYHTPGGNNYTYLSFNMTNPINQFNNIRVNRTGTAIASLSATNKILPSSVTGNAGYLQYTTGSMVKISFPFLRNILTLPNFVKIIKAQLLVKPVKNSFSLTYALPPQLILAQTDITNAIGTTIPGTGNLYIDQLQGFGTSYTYDLTRYFQQLIQIPDDNNVYGYGLLLLPPNETAILNRLVVGDIRQSQNYATEVQIYYAAVQ
ncbi:MAG TPA: DUF4270 family protein [Ferruginibacter sp.]|nr:DUF4270 family protein [Ferruginibacter sp.]